MSDCPQFSPPELPLLHEYACSAAAIVSQLLQGQNRPPVRLQQQQLYGAAPEAERIYEYRLYGYKTYSDKYPFDFHHLSATTYARSPGRAQSSFYSRNAPLSECHMSMTCHSGRPPIYPTVGYGTALDVIGTINRFALQGLARKVKVSAAPRTSSSGRCFPSSNAVGGRETLLPPSSGRRLRASRTRCAPRLSKTLDAGASFRCATPPEPYPRPDTHLFSVQHSYKTHEVLGLSFCIRRHLGVRYESTWGGRREPAASMTKVISSTRTITAAAYQNSTAAVVVRFGGASKMFERQSRAHTAPSNSSTRYLVCIPSSASLEITRITALLLTMNQNLAYSYLSLQPTVVYRCMCTHAAVKAQQSSQPDKPAYRTDEFTV